jgi:hypothetical protein
VQVQQRRAMKRTLSGTGGVAWAQHALRPTAASLLVFAMS